MLAHASNNYILHVYVLHAAHIFIQSEICPLNIRTQIPGIFDLRPMRASHNPPPAIPEIVFRGGFLVFLCLCVMCGRVGLHTSIHLSATPPSLIRNVRHRITPILRIGPPTTSHAARRLDAFWQQVRDIHPRKCRAP